MLNFTIHFSPCDLLHVPVRFRVSIYYADCVAFFVRDLSPGHISCAITDSGVVTGDIAGGNPRGPQIPRPSIDW